MTSENLTNPLARLLDLIENMRHNAGLPELRQHITPNSNEVKMLYIASSAIRPTFFDKLPNEPEMYYDFFEFQKLAVESFRFVVTASNPKARSRNVEIVRELLNNIMIISPRHGHKILDQIGEPLKASAHMISENLWEKNTVIIADQEALEGLKAQLDSLFDKVKQSHLPEEVKTRLLDQITNIRSVLAKSEYLDSNQLIAETERLIGQATLSVPLDESEHQSEAREIFMSSLEFLKNVKDSFEIGQYIFVAATLAYKALLALPPVGH